MERRDGVEIRAEGRTLVGPIINYGEVSPSHRERFEPGSLLVEPNAYLEYRHNPMVAVAHGDDFVIEDTPQALMGRATLPNIPAADLALEEVRSGRITGFSVAFKALEETRDADGIRVIQKAIVPRVGLVAKPSYQGSMVEARSERRRRVWL